MKRERNGRTMKSVLKWPIRGVRSLNAIQGAQLLITYLLDISTIILLGLIYTLGLFKKIPHNIKNKRLLQLKWASLLTAKTKSIQPIQPTTKTTPTNDTDILHTPSKAPCLQDVGLKNM